MKSSINRMDLYERIYVQREHLASKGEELGRSVGIPPELKGLLGTSGASSAMPGSIRQDVLDAMASVSDEFVSLRSLGDEVRRLGFGTVDRDGQVNEVRMRLVVRALFSAMVMLLEFAAAQSQTVAVS